MINEKQLTHIRVYIEAIIEAAIYRHEHNCHDDDEDCSINVDREFDKLKAVLLSNEDK
jgi:hypothetical protein